MPDPVQDRVFTGAVLFQDVFQNDMPSALLEHARRERAVQHVGGGVPVEKPGNGVVRNEAQIMQTGFQHQCGNEKSDGAGDQIADVRPLLMLSAPADEKDDGDREHQYDRDDQRGDRGFADGDVRKVRHFSSPPHTSTQKPLCPHAVQVSLRVVGVWFAKNASFSDGLNTS